MTTIQLTNLKNYTYISQNDTRKIFNTLTQEGNYIIYRDGSIEFYPQIESIIDKNIYTSLPTGLNYWRDSLKEAGFLTEKDELKEDIDEEAYDNFIDEILSTEVNSNPWHQVTKDDITATYPDNENKFIEIVFDNCEILRVNYRDLPFDLSEKDDDFNLTDDEFETLLQEGEWTLSTPLF